MKFLLGGLGLLAVLALGAVFILFRADMAAARERLEGASQVLPSPFGPLEFAEGGDPAGPPVLVVHGGGGGFDQGELVARAVLDEGFRWIAPSRFGYLGSAAPEPREAAGFDAQAHAFAWLLDALGIEAAAVVALSQGGPSALYFALLHPDRVTSLTLLSAGVTPVTGEEQAAADAKGAGWVRLFRHDFPYWIVTRAFRRPLMGLMGADRRVIEGLDPVQREWIDQVIDRMNPVSLRSTGAELDNTNPLPGERIAGIRAPTLVVHAEDDTLQLFENGRIAAATIPGAEFLRFERGGHFVIILEQDTVRGAVGRHIRDHLPAGF